MVLEFCGILSKQRRLVIEEKGKPRKFFNKAKKVLDKLSSKV